MRPNSNERGNHERKEKMENIAFGGLCRPRRCVGHACMRLVEFRHDDDNHTHHDAERSHVMKKIIFCTLIGLLLAPNAFAGVNTAVATVKLYKAYMSTSGDCSSPVTFFNAETDMANFPNGYAEVDMVAGPTIGSGTLADGTYQCVIFKMSDRVTFTPSANDGTACVAGTSYTIDVCWSYDGTTPITIQNAETGAQTSCTAASGTEDTVWVYVSTYAAATTGSQNNNAFMPPTSNGDATHGFVLASGQIVFSSNMIGTFVFGTDGIVASLPYGPSGAAVCNMDPPTFGFRTATQ